MMTAAIILAEAFVQGASLALAVYYLWKNKKDQ